MIYVHWQLLKDLRGWLQALRADVVTAWLAPKSSSATRWRFDLQDFTLKATCGGSLLIVAISLIDLMVIRNAPGAVFLKVRQHKCLNILSLLNAHAEKTFEVLI